VLVAVVALLAVACSGSSSHRQAAATTTAPLTSVTTPSTTVAAVPACGTADLTLTAGPGTLNATASLVTYTLTNTGAAPCTMSGYPGVAVLDAHGVVVQQPASRQAGPAATPPVTPTSVLLAPGGQATFLLAGTDSIGGSCAVPPYTATTLQVIPPNQTEPIDEPYAGIACGLAVGPVRDVPPGSSPPSTVPGVINQCPQAPPQGQIPTVKPTSIVFACADAGLGADQLAWTSWNNASAAGTGEIYENNCTPNCAAGTFIKYPASFALSNRVNSVIGPLFSTLTASYTGTGPNGQKTQAFDVPVPPE
jgi:hypothetical protein